MKRAAIAAFVLVTLWACNDHHLATPTPAPTGSAQSFFDQNVNNDLDILFLVDDSMSMQDAQTNLVTNFPVFINVLKTLPAGLPNVHIAVTTSSMGAGAFSSGVPGCSGGDAGNFVYQVRASMDPTCPQNRITDARHFIESFGNGAQNNFTGDISTVFSCIAQVGANGCGLEHQLAAVRAALGDPAMNLAPPPGNDGFLRDNAYLAIIWITNEDDCSVPPNSLLFDPSGTLPQGFRCIESGILCDGQRPPTMPAGPLQNCVSNDTAFETDPLHSLYASSFFIEYFQRLKPNRTIAAAVAAPTEPFSIVLDASGGLDIGSSCTGANGIYGKPGVRIKHVIDSFGDLGTYTNVCDTSYADAMRVIAQKIGQKLGRQCIEGQLAQPPDFKQALARPANGAVVDPSTVSCSVEDVIDIGKPTQYSAGVVPPCNPAGQASGACWALIGDDTCTTAGVKMAICRNGFSLADPAKPCPDGANSAPANDTAVIHCATVP